MSKYKISVKVDEQNKFWIVVDSEKFIRYPTNIDLKDAKLWKYNDTNICPICRKKNNITDKSILYPKNAARGIKTGEWVCKNDRREKVNPKSKVYVSLDENNFFWIVSEHGNLDKNPKDEDLYATLKEYNDTNICPICRKVNNITDRSILYPDNSLREKDKDGKETGRWICQNCRQKDYQRDDPNSQHNTLKLLRDRRINNQKPYHSNTIGDNFQKLGCEWKGWTDLNKEKNNYKSSVDCIDKETGLMYQIKGRFYDPKYGTWRPGGGLEHEHTKEFEKLIFFCASADGNIIERVYIFDWEIIYSRKNVSIVKNPSRGKQWYEEYRLNDEEELKKINEIWKKIIDK